MRSQLDLVFKKCKKENRPALLTYTVAGDNTKKKSLEILKTTPTFSFINEKEINVWNIKTRFSEEYYLPNLRNKWGCRIILSQRDDKTVTTEKIQIQ